MHLSSSLPHLSSSRLSQGKGLIADFLSDVFTYTFDVLANKKDSALLGIKEEASPALARDRINTIASLMFYAHLAVFLDYVTDAPPITVNSHPEVDDFRQLVSRICRPSDSPRLQPV